MEKYFFIFLAISIFLIGCGPRPRAGTVELQGAMPAGSNAKDIPYTSVDGVQTTFHKERAPIALIAFVNAPNACCWVAPGLLNLTNRFEDLPVSVAQITMPGSKCPHGPGCVEMCHLGKTRLFSFCDSEGIAWKAYGQPKAGSVILIDQRDQVVATGTLNDMAPVTNKAYQLGKDLRAKNPDMTRRSMFFGTR